MSLLGNSLKYRIWRMSRYCPKGSSVDRFRRGSRIQSLQTCESSTDWHIGVSSGS